MPYKSKRIHKLKKKKKLITRPVFWIVVLLILVVGGLAYVILFLPQLQVASITVSGNANVKSQDIESIALNDVNRQVMPFISSKSILIVDDNKIGADIFHAFADIATVSVQNRLPNQVAVSVTERKPFADFCQTQPDATDRCFVIDDDGVIFEPLAAPDSSMFIVRLTSDNANTALGSAVVDKSSIDAITKIQKMLQDNFQIGIKEVSAGQILIVTTSEGWQAYFDINQDIDYQITELNALLKDQIPDAARKKLSYIYLQYQDKVYYK